MPYIARTSRGVCDPRPLVKLGGLRSRITGSGLPELEADRKPPFHGLGAKVLAAGDSSLWRYP